MPVEVHRGLEKFNCIQREIGRSDMMKGGRRILLKVITFVSEFNASHPERKNLFGQLVKASCRQ